MTKPQMLQWNNAKKRDISKKYYQDMQIKAVARRFIQSLNQTSYLAFLIF